MADPDRLLPGADLLDAGLADLDRGRTTAAGLLVAIGAPRLRALGLPIPPDDRLPADPELALYRLLGAAHGGDAHGQFNALVRRLVSFERALERDRSRN